MKRIIVLLLLLKITTSAFCQAQIYQKVERELKESYKNTVAIPKPRDIFINRFNKTIDIEGHQILLDSIKITYVFDDSQHLYKHKVKFECENSNCINDYIDNKYVSGLKISFKDKLSCYNFINLLYELKELVNNR